MKKKCFGCKKMKAGVKRQTIFLPALNQSVTSQVEMCGACKRGVEKALKGNIVGVK